MNYEYQYQSLKKLEGNDAKNIRIPKSIIIDTEMLNIRISVFVYLSIYKGLNDRVNFSIPLFLEWAGYKNDAHKGGINDKVIQTLDSLYVWEYVKYHNGLPKRRSFSEIEFNTQLVHDMCYCESFAIIYLDEIERIMRYTNENSQDRYLNRNTILLVFAYLRQAIYRAPNKLKPEERSAEGVEARKKWCIEAYNDTYKDIAFNLGLSERTVSLAVDVLVKMNLIVIAEAYRIKDEEGNYRTPDIIFANAYKREGNQLLDTSEDYAWEQIRNKEKMIQKYNPHYHLRGEKKPA